MKGATIDLRTSSDDERPTEDGTSIARQREHATAFAEQRGGRVDPARLDEDDGGSGGEVAATTGSTRKGGR